MTDRRLIVDACCLINLDSSGQLLDIASIFSPPLAVCDIVTNEITAIEQLAGDTGQALRSKLIEEFMLSDSELDLFVDYVFHMGDDGESATFAAAVSRNWSVATDDKAAIKFLRKRAPEIRIVSTLEIIRHWSETQGKTPEEVQRVLLAIRDKGRYFPGKGHLLYSWWYDIIGK